MMNKSKPKTRDSSPAPDSIRNRAKGRAKTKQSKAMPKAAVKPPEDALSVSALADKFDIQDRATVRKRLKGVTPAYVASRLKLYRLTEKNKEGRTVQELLEVGDGDPKFIEAKTRKMMADARRAEHKLEVDEGKYLLLSEVREHAFNLVKAMHQRFTRYAKEARRRYKLSADQGRQMETDTALIFDDLKRDYPDIL